jgi:hypothetical protein
MNHKRKKRKIKTLNGYLPGDGPRGNSKQKQTKQEQVADIEHKEQSNQRIQHT